MRDAELAEQLAAWLTREVGATVRVGAWRRPASGMSNDTIVVDVEWDHEPHRVVVRLAPSGRPLFPRYDLEAQVAVLGALAARTDVPVPTVLWCERDSGPLGRPFYVMEFVEGRIPPDGHLFSGWVKELPPADQGRLLDGALDVVARIHRVDLAGMPALEVLDRPDHGPAPLDQELGWWRNYLDWASGGEHLPRLEDALARLVESRPPDEDVGRGLVWGDARLGNLVVDASLRPVAVLDWEMAVLGPAELDIGWYLFLDRTARQFAPPLPGFPETERLVASYEHRLGRPLRHLAWFEAWSGFRTACIQLRLAESHEARERNPVTKALHTCLAELGARA